MPVRSRRGMDCSAVRIECNKAACDARKRDCWGRPAMTKRLSEHAVWVTTKAPPFPQAMTAAGGWSIKQAGTQ
ncbi:hypothetical protein HaLaN_27633 [Haematococcus lacustris]|uniref:Uncharacterized protein n=1 Tax=Haematococcus lacustris TaxID=44745 RepID=A0A6A0A9F5_HAELA|nr:hypothetical protein HaLaN_27633 [Haematococcus lacustris]